MSQIVESHLTQPVSARDHIKGSLTAPVEVVEYGDFECPHCGQAYLVMKEIQRQLGDKMCFVFRNFPLTSAHPHAELAAEAAEAAGAQNKFWEMHDQIFEHQRALEVEDLVRYAGQLGLDTSRFIQDLSESRYAKRVREDFSSGARSGVNGTPTFFLNGKRHDGSYQLSAMLAAIRQAAREKR